MKSLGPLTTELLRKKFKNNFDLCNFSIEIARNMIANGDQVNLQDTLDMVEARSDEDIEGNAFLG